MATTHRAFLVAASVIVAACLVACSPSGSADAGGASAGAAVATTVVDLPPSYRFAPDAILVATGSTVTWINHDNFTHSVQFLDEALATEPLLMQPGASTTFTFDAPGTYGYVCHLHPQDMRGTVTVRP